MAVRIAITAALIGCMTSAAVAQDTEIDPAGTYICKMNASAGLVLNQDRTEWSGTVFSSGETLLMKITATGGQGTYKTAIEVPFDKYKAEFKTFGAEGNAIGCVSPFLNENGMFSSEFPILSGRFQCRYFNTNYAVDLNLKRMLIMFEGGYLDDWKENRDTPYISAGVCEKVS